MNIFNRFKKGSSQGIIPINHKIPLPTRESFIDNQKMLDLIDIYKNEYKKLLSQFKYFTSLDINSKDLNKNMSTNIELLLNIFMTSDEVRQYTLKDKIDFLINIRKLDLYKIAIYKLEAEVTARLIALNEIYNERKTYISDNKRNALANEINNLFDALLPFLNNKFAIELEKNNYLTNAIYMTENINDPTEEDRLIAKKRTMLLNISHILFPESKIEIRENKENVLMDIAQVEKMIEIYVYNHKNEVEYLRKQLERINEREITYKNKENLLSLLKNLEYRYLAFYEYGREYIAIEDLMQLYLIKFNILVLSENDICETFVDENTTEVELNCYKGIIEREIQSFIKGECDLNNPEVIKIIINILKKGAPFLDAEQILKDKYLLNVLLSMWSKKSLINLLKNFKVKKKDYGKFDFCDEVFEFDEDIPLETIYRLMLAQNIGYDAKLYEFLEDDIYPDQKYYYLPVGLKAINYNIEESVEEHVLNKSTLLTIQQMRKMMNGKYVVCPSSLIRIKGGIDLFKPASIKNILFSEGLEIMIYDTSDIEILEREDTKIVYHDKRTSEIICSDLECYIDKKWGHYNTAGLITYVPSKSLFIEDYHSYECDESILQRCKNVIDVRRKDKNLVFSRTYVDVSTKYGDFCLHIEEKNTDNEYGPHVWLSLYHGNHNEIIDELSNDFNWPEYGIFRTKYMKKNEFYQWMLGFVDNVWNHPFRNIWSYGQTKVGKNTSNSPIYSFNEYQGYGKRGTIFIDGSIKLKENKECIPDMFENLEVDEYENISYNSKAYFGTPSEHVAILKYLNSNNIKIIYKQKNKRSGNFEEKATTTIQSNTNKEFNEHDFEQIVAALEEMPINKFLKKYIIDEIKTYIAIYFRNNRFYIGEFPDDSYINLSNTLKQDGYDILVDILDRHDATEVVEKLIESISQIFHISIDELLGKPKLKETKKQEESKITKQLILKNKKR